MVQASKSFQVKCTMHCLCSIAHTIFQDTCRHLKKSQTGMSKGTTGVIFTHLFSWRDL